jgi:hypothetical protein
MVSIPFATKMVVLERGGTLAIKPMLAGCVTLEHILVPLDHMHLLTRRTGDDGSSSPYYNPRANHSPMKYDGSF